MASVAIGNALGTSCNLSLKILHVVCLIRMVGGVLVERTVKEVVPALINNRDKMAKLIESLEKQLTEKGEEINGYMEKHNIQLKDQPGAAKKEDKGESDAKSGGVLVSN